MENNRQQDFSSNFVSKNGLIGIFLAFLVSVYFQKTMLSAFLLFLWLLCFSSYYWGRTALKKVSLKIEAESLQVYQNNEVEIKYTIINDKWLPLIWLELLQPVASNKCFVSNSAFGEMMYHDFQLDTEYLVFCRNFSWIMWHARAEFTAKFTAVHHGVYVIDRYTMISGDGFGLSVLPKRFRLLEPVTFVVYPEIVEIDPSVFLRNMFNSAAGAKGIYEDQTLLKSNRSYQPQDSFKKINWRMAAKTNELSVNVYETIMPKSVFFILDVGSFPEVKKDDTQMEKMLSTAASAVLALENVQMTTGVLVPQTEKSEGRCILPVAETVDRKEILMAISALEYEDGKVEFDFEEILRARETIGHFFVFTYSMERCTCKDLLETIDPSMLSFLISQRGDQDEFYQNELLPVYAIRKEENS